MRQVHLWHCWISYLAVQGTPKSLRIQENPQVNFIKRILVLFTLAAAAVSLVPAQRLPEVAPDVGKRAWSVPVVRVMRD